MASNTEWSGTDWTVTMSIQPASGGDYFTKVELVGSAKAFTGPGLTGNQYILPEKLSSSASGRFGTLSAAREQAEKWAAEMRDMYLAALGEHDALRARLADMQAQCDRAWRTDHG